MAFAAYGVALTASFVLVNFAVSHVRCVIIPTMKTRSYYVAELWETELFRWGATDENTALSEYLAGFPEVTKGPAQSFLVLRSGVLVCPYHAESYRRIASPEGARLGYIVDTYLGTAELVKEAQTKVPQLPKLIQRYMVNEREFCPFDIALVNVYKTRADWAYKQLGALPIDSTDGGD